MRRIFKQVLIKSGETVKHFSKMPYQAQSVISYNHRNEPRNAVEQLSQWFEQLENDPAWMRNVLLKVNTVLSRKRKRRMAKRVAKSVTTRG